MRTFPPKRTFPLLKAILGRVQTFHAVTEENRAISAWIEFWRGTGSIVNIGSMWAKQAVQATPSSAYSMVAASSVHRLERLLRDRYHVASIVRTMKPTFARPAPPGIIEQLPAVDAVVEAVAD